jgi:hypothetical protein
MSGPPIFGAQSHLAIKLIALWDVTFLDKPLGQEDEHRLSHVQLLPLTGTYWM